MIGRKPLDVRWGGRRSKASRTVFWWAVRLGVHFVKDHQLGSGLAGIACRGFSPWAPGPARVEERG